MLKVNYLTSEWVDVPNIIEYFKDQTGIKDSTKVKQFYDNLKFVFPGTTSGLQIIQGENLYKFSITYKRTILGWIIYIPSEKRFDIYESGNIEIPMIQVKQKKIYHRTYSDLLAAANIEKIFEKLINIA